MKSENLKVLPDQIRPRIENANAVAMAIGIAICNCNVTALAMLTAIATAKCEKLATNKKTHFWSQLQSELQLQLLGPCLSWLGLAILALVVGFAIPSRGGVAPSFSWRGCPSGGNWSSLFGVGVGPAFSCLELALARLSSGGGGLFFLVEGFASLFGVVVGGLLFLLGVAIGPSLLLWRRGSPLLLRVGDWPFLDLALGVGVWPFLLEVARRVGPEPRKSGSAKGAPRVEPRTQ